MPKRIPTPPPADDEPRYLTVVHPYVPDGHCNMELPKDRQDFARWVACCIDPKYIYAFFHKPSARDMVILEVARECCQLDQLLGEHRWLEFLRNPTEQDKVQVSKVFYCTYSTGRLVQKNGWKRIYVEDSWFNTWSPKNHFITFPYPETHFCDVPTEDQTNHPMCRPLPGAVKPPPPQELTAPPPVVGSKEWISSKQLPVIKPKASAWSKAIRKAPMPVGNAWKAAIVTSAPAISGVKKQPAIGGGTIAVKASDVWVGLHTPPTNAPNGWADTPTGSGMNTPARNTSSPLPVSSQGQTSDVPPGLSAKTAWNGGTSCPTRPPGIPAVHSIDTAPRLNRDNTSSASWSSSGRSSSTGTDIVLTPQNTPDDDPYTVHVTASDSMESALDELSIGDDLQHDADPDLTELDAIAPGNWNEPMNAEVTWTGYTETDGDTWDGTPEDAESFWKTRETKETDETKKIICSAHGIICKKGICREYSKQVREAERAEKEATTDPKKGKGRGRGRDRGRGGAFGNFGGRGRGGPDRGGPPNAFRGRGAPVRTNWRGTPRAIVSAATIEQRENSKDAEDVAETPNAWGNTSDSFSPAVEDAPQPSEDGWGGTVASYDPWAPVPEQPKARPQSKPQPQPRKNAKPQTKTQSQPQRNQKTNSNAKTTNKPSWADQMETHSAAGYPEDDGVSSVGSKRGQTAKAPKSSTSGWGTIDEQPWS